MSFKESYIKIKIDVLLALCDTAFM
uniref:Uncharacterized protein n=1 Tax=Anguilla anguilla TaxID=7936 RepID=A0A0E9XD71_ANGAN